ncbi:unnamed protein product [Amoebophrya sp. A120]|nr:unnamed protein product [Amoebophrya sp. A120]|eukprot:GSA120T00001010001.1
MNTHADDAQSINIKHLTSAAKFKLFSTSNPPKNTRIHWYKYTHSV